ncbi:hypothetical protein Cni_G17334 [Canna indica]|uniref:FAS1 domain-containing protein n=1 Tax=Canna indica TaxID=4628 RepID=A0AAQ3QGH4_9LILI|nr:hypothetical protein Cni_G17334 [Canna indica]
MAAGAHASFAFFLLLISSASAAFNILEILEPFGDEYSTFTKYLTDTKIADEINSRSTVTVLLVANPDIAPLASLSDDALKQAIYTHVLADYYDLYNLPRKSSALLPTLGGGSVNCTGLPDERVLFGSSELLKVVAARPYNLSVLGISAPLTASGSDKTTGAAVPTTTTTEAASTTSPVAAAPTTSTVAAAKSTIAPAPISAAGKRVVGAGIGLVMGVVALATIWNF